MAEKRAHLMLILLSSIYMIAELGHYLIGVVNRSIAQELHYGDQACLPNPNVSYSTSKLCDNANSSETCELISIQPNEFGCVWDYNGLGLEYQWLAGPSFIVAYTIAGIIWGIAADSYNRVNLLSIGTIIVSLGITLSSFATAYWQLVVLRALLAIGNAACSPLAASMISDLFPPKQRALAMAIFVWGIYIGYGFSYAIGNYVTEANILCYGWRSSFMVSGIPGFIIAAFFFFTVEDPTKKLISESPIDNDTNLEIEGNKYEIKSEKDNGSSIEQNTTEQDKTEKLFDEDETSYWATWKSCLSPTVLLLVIASCIRHTAGFTWGYNSALYFQTYYPEYDTGWWLTGISIFGGMLGSAIGGYVSDRLVTRLGVAARAAVLAGSQLLATPFMIGLLYLNPPYAFFSLLIGYLVAEMWFGVVFVIFVELVPFRLRSTAIGVVLFIINNVGGNLPVLVAPVSDYWNLRTAITIFYPGALITSSILFFILCIALRNRK